MTKDEIKAFIELKQADIPFEVKDRAEALPLEGSEIPELCFHPLGEIGV